MEAAKAIECAGLSELLSIYIGSDLVKLEEPSNSSCSSAAFLITVSPHPTSYACPLHLKYYRELMSVQPIFIQGGEVGDHRISALHVC